MKQPQQKSLATFLRHYMLRPVLSQRKVLISILIALVFLSLTQASFLILIKGFLAAFFASTSSDELSIAAMLPENFIARFPGLDGVRIARSDVVVYVPLSILLVGLLKAVASYVYGLGVVRLSLKVAQNYREKVFQAIISMPYLESSRRSPGEWMSVIMADAVFIQARLSDFSTAFIKDGVLIVSCLVSLALIHWPAAVTLLIISPVIAWQMGRAGKKISWFTEAFQRELGGLSGMLLGIRERFRFMRAQRGESFEKSHFEARNRSYLEMMNGSIFLRAIVAPGMELIGFLIFSAFIYAWTRKVPGFAVAPDVAIQFFVALGLILKPIREVGEQVARWSETIGGLRRSMEVVDFSSSSGDFQTFQPGGVQFAEDIVEDSIRISEIRISYDDRLVLRAEGLCLKKGTAVAIIGPSGSGKSTLLKSFSGLVKPNVWKADLGWDKFVSNSALVSQQPFLFKDSILNNLTYGLSPAHRSSVSNSDVLKALAAVNLTEWNDDEARTLQSEFNPVQTNLSGGQIQRLVIARALLRKPQVLLLDEATSAVDAATEQDISERLIKFSRENSAFMISVTHRLRWLSLYDEVWFVEDGKVELKGSHTELLTNDRYRSFCMRGVDA